jgi:glycosyltransferase 2 family protein
MENIKSKVVLGLLFGAIVIVGLALAADLPKVLDAVRGFEWGWLPLILGLTSFNYLLRFVKWHYYLRQMGIDHIAWADSLKVFLGGFAMTVTPGKIGEAFKSLWLKNLTGAGMARTLPVVAAERLSDALACALLASVGVAAYPKYWPVFTAILAVLIGGIIVIQIRALSLWLLGIAEHLPLVSRFSHSLCEFYESSYELLSLKNLTVAVGLGTVSWAGEGAAFCLVLKGLGVPMTVALLSQAIFILAFSVIIGGASTLPGGLGAAEVSLAGMLVFVVGLPRELAASAALLIRFCTLWFGVTLGFTILTLFRHQLFVSHKSKAGDQRSEDDDRKADVSG